MSVDIDLQNMLVCSRSAQKYFSAFCIQNREKTMLLMSSYNVLTKGQAINFLLPMVDFSLWDSDLAKKKSVIIETDL